jgi:alkane 1-monooxygenase
LLEAAGLTLSAGVTTGVFGFLAAHEMVHSPDRRERALGLVLLGSVFYMHFRIAHIHGHHLRAATVEDPASARLGEGLYVFLARSVVGQVREAWTFETERLRRTGRPVFGPENRMLQYFSVETLLLVAVALLSLRALLFVLVVAALAIAMLEGFNYVAHYGLTRAVEADGRAERLAPHHSWNSVRKMNNTALFNMGRHSDHHRTMTRSYEALEQVSGSAELPAGYAAALLTALVPPLWRKVMDPRARAAMRRA